MEKRLSKIKGLYLGVLIYYSILLIIGLIRWTNSEYGFTQTDDIQYFLDSIFSTLSLFTGLHLLNRSKKFEGQFKKLFIFTGFTFFIIFFIFFYHLIDVIWEWVFEIGFIRQLNFLMDPPGLKFDLIYPFALPFQIISGSSSNTGVISINSSFTFLISLVSLLLYMYPMEKYVKGSKNLWHSIWILITILLIPIFLIILKFDFLGQSNLILSIGCDFILMSYMFNILWIMLLYLKISIKSPRGTPLRKAGVLIALGLGMSFYIIVMKIGMFIMAESYVPAYLGGTLAEGINEFDLEVIIRELPGFFAFIFFNLGFYLIKPIQIEE